MKRTYKDHKLLLHSQVRIGKAKKRKGKARPTRGIVVTKIRSMKKGAHADFDARDRNVEAHVTRVGRILRKYHLDELPQIISWLKGDLKAVGPRPLTRRGYQRLTPKRRKIYDEVGPGVFGIEYACRHFPPSQQELTRTFEEFHKMWKRDKIRAYTEFGIRIMRNAFGKEINKELMAAKPKPKK